jgi:putative membrane protein
VKLSPDPVALVLLALSAALYVRAARALRRRGQPIGRWQQASWWTGMALLTVALCGPVDGYSDDLLFMHMLQHMLLGDIAAPFLVAGLRTPMLQWFLPAPVLAPLARRRSLRRLFRFVRLPVVALVLYGICIVFWHLAFAFEGALRHEPIHALQHESFLIFNGLLWWVVLEPQRRRMPGELWKIGHIFAARMFTMFLGVGLIFSKTPWYGAFYGHRAEEHGLSPLQDQQIGGGIMMTLDVLIMFTALCIFFWRAASDADRAEAREAAGRPPAPVT